MAFKRVPLTLSATEEERIQIMALTGIELTASVLEGVRGYLLDHSGDEGYMNCTF